MKLNAINISAAGILSLCYISIRQQRLGSMDPHREEVIAKLMELGIERLRAEGAVRRAVELGQGGTVESAMELLFSSPSQAQESTQATLDADAGFAASEESKLVVLVRQDLVMTPGKIAAQVAHAALALHRQMVAKRFPVSVVQGDVDVWDASGEKIVVVGVADEAELRAHLQHAADLGLMQCSISDAGRTQVLENTLTCGAVFGSGRVVDAVTSALKLM